MYNLVHYDEGKDAHEWPWIYLHGEAEYLNDAYGRERMYESATDLICGKEPVPEKAGLYDGLLHGQPVKIVIHIREYRDSLGELVQSFKCGRVALVSDSEAITHINNPENWR